MRNHALAAAAVAILATGPVAAADLAIPPPPPVAPPAYYNWTGFYAGVNLGVGASAVRTTATARAMSTTATARPAGLIGGGQIGYNYQLANWVFGAETDFQGSSGRGTATLANLTLTDSQPWFGTARARAGYTLAPGWLAYATGGLAYAQTRIAGTIAGVGTFNETSTHAGWTAGGGLEAGVYGNWTVKLEYLYVDIGVVNFNTVVGGVPVMARSHIDGNVFRAGLNYRF